MLWGQDGGKPTVRSGPVRVVAARRDADARVVSRVAEQRPDAEVQDCDGDQTAQAVDRHGSVVVRLVAVESTERDVPRRQVSNAGGPEHQQADEENRTVAARHASTVAILHDDLWRDRDQLPTA